MGFTDLVILGVAVVGGAVIESYVPFALYVRTGSYAIYTRVKAWFTSNPLP